jgi:hypothetical protein
VDLAPEATKQAEAPKDEKFPAMPKKNVAPKILGGREVNARGRQPPPGQ